MLSASINFFVFLALFLVLSVSTFMSSEIRRAAQRTMPIRVPRSGMGWRLSGVAASVSLGMLVITGVLFFLLPRTARAALQHVFQHRYHLAGFSNSVDLGEIGELKQQDTPFMHVKMEMTADRLPFLRWRGAALSHFDGRRWTNQPAPEERLRPEPDSPGKWVLSNWRRGRGLSYAVHLNDASDGVLFFAGTPQSLRIDASYILRTANDSYLRVGGNYSSLNYQVFSYLDPSSSDPEGGIAEPPPRALPQAVRSTYLQMPHLDPRIANLTHRITDAEPSVEKKARALERYLRDHYGYTLELPQVEAADPLANFLFRRRKGHCEYFASAMAVMLRTIGIPSRVVTGFAGGVYNPVSGWYMIRTSDAHSWVEAYVPQIGWTTFDPTPPDFNLPRFSILTRIGFYVDAAEVFWQDWVLDYNLDRQLLLTARMEQSSRNLRTNWLDQAANVTANLVQVGSRYGGALILCGVSVFLLFRFKGPGMRWWAKHRSFRRVQRGEVQPSDATLLYERMLKVLKRRGVEKPPWLTPFEFARIVQDPELSVLVEDITCAYNELRFGRRPDAAGTMLRLLLRLESQGT